MNAVFMILQKIFSYLLITFLLISLLPKVIHASNENMIARYNMNTIDNQTMMDTINKLNGVINGNITLIKGKYGNAYNFDGSSFINVSNNSLLEPNNISIELWVKAPTSPGAYKYIVAKGASGNIGASYALYTGINGGLQFYISKGEGTVYLSPDAGTGIWDNNWHKVLAFFDGSSVRLYVDGSQIGEGTATTDPIAYNLPSSNDLYIGSYNGQSDYNFVGQIDELRIWSNSFNAKTIEQHSSSNSSSNPKN